MITIIDYGLGNLVSVKNMLKKLGIPSVITDQHEAIRSAQKLILPGVGSFDNGMNLIREKGLQEILNTKVQIEKTPILGICLGMQLLTKSSEEGREPGLGWIDATTVKFEFKDRTLKIPHMGWNYITVKKENPLLHRKEKQRFYFVHSYYVKCNDANDIIATSEYGTDFTCAVNHGNIYGAQFHPEKSLKFGMELLSNFATL
jgi:imidazole glycerol-phosphate synthase subunit HisH